MPASASEIRALTASAFTAPEKFREFCRNGGKPLGGIIDGEHVAGSMNATFQTIDPGSQEVLATVCEMGEAEVARAVAAADRAFHGTARLEERGRRGADRAGQASSSNSANAIGTCCWPARSATAARCPSWRKATSPRSARAPSTSAAWPGGSRWATDRR